MGTFGLIRGVNRWPRRDRVRRCQSAGVILHGSMPDCVCCGRGVWFGDLCAVVVSLVGFVVALVGCALVVRPGELVISLLASSVGVLSISPLSLCLPPFRASFRWPVLDAVALLGLSLLSQWYTLAFPSLSLWRSSVACALGWLFSLSLRKRFARSGLLNTCPLPENFLIFSQVRLTL